MNGEGFENPNRNRNIAIAIGAVVLVIVLVAAAVVIFRKSGEGTGIFSGPDASGQPGPAVPSSGPGDSPSLEVPEPPPVIIDPSLDRPLTDEEKDQLGYPLEWDVRLRAAIPEGGGKPYPDYVIVSTPGDQDQDGLQDEKERELGTDPAKADTDGDGLTDDDEVARGTDPRRSDTDGDGTSDQIEVDAKTDPTKK